MATQIVRRTITQPGDGTDFLVLVSPAQATDTYAVAAQIIAGGVLTTLELPDVVPTDRQTTSFRVISSATLPSGAVLEFILVS